MIHWLEEVRGKLDLRPNALLRVFVKNRFSLDPKDQSHLPLPAVRGYRKTVLYGGIYTLFGITKEEAAEILRKQKDELKKTLKLPKLLLIEKFRERFIVLAFSWLNAQKPSLELAQAQDNLQNYNKNSITLETTEALIASLRVIFKDID